jgi:hypothetical protein
VSLLYRCGYCGQPTDQDGEVIEMSEIELNTQLTGGWDSAEQTHGDCCSGQYAHELEQRQVTREMAQDAQDLSLEGSYI